jgi:hypothetical protein
MKEERAILAGEFLFRRQGGREVISKLAGQPFGP